MNPMESASQWIVLARILRPQGRRGELLADLFTDFPQRFRRQPRVWLAPQGFADSPAAASPSTETSPSIRPAEVASHWLPVGRNASRIVLRFASIDSIEQAAPLAGFEVLVPLAERTPIDPGAAYISDLIGCTVFDRGQPLGAVAAVHFPTTPDGARRLEDAAPLLILATTSGDELLVPFARAFLVELDPAAKSIRMALPEGLAEINLQPNRGPNLKPNRAVPEK
jgi:16S rRNA processing protein RimM